MNNPDEMTNLPPSEGEGDYADLPEHTDPLGATVSPAQARLIYRMTMPNMIMRVLRFLLPHDAASLVEEATEKLLADDIIGKVVLGEGKTYALIYERLVALQIIADQKLGVEAMAYLNNDDPLQVRIDPSLVEEEISGAHTLSVIPTALTFNTEGLPLFNFDEDSFMVFASVVARVRKGGGTTPRAHNFCYIYRCEDVELYRNDKEAQKKIRSQSLSVSRQAVLELLRDNPRTYFGVFTSEPDEVAVLIDVDIFRATDYRGNIFI